jgi:hypothetical protein
MTGELRATDIPEVAHTLAREAARLILSQSHEHAWRCDLLAEQLVRIDEIRLRPDVAFAHVVMPALQARFDLDHPTTTVPESRVIHTSDGVPLQPRMRPIRVVPPGDKALLESRLRALREKLAQAVDRAEWVDACAALDPFAIAPTTATKKKGK